MSGAGLERQEKSGDPFPVSSLAALIHKVIAQESADGHELGYAEIARRGFGISRGNVRSYATIKQRRILDVDKRRGLALGLRVHDVLVDRAMAEDLDLMLEPLEPDWRTDPDLTRQDRERIEAFIQGIKEAKGQARRDA